MTRRLTAPWIVTKTPGGYSVSTGGGIRLAYVYERTTEQGARHEVLSPDEARRVAKAIARLPELLPRKAE